MLIPQFNALFFNNLVLLVLKEEVIPTLGARVNLKYILGWLYSFNKNGALPTDIMSALIGNDNSISGKKQQQLTNSKRLLRIFHGTTLLYLYLLVVSNPNQRNQ